MGTSGYEWIGLNESEWRGAKAVLQIQQQQYFYKKYVQKQPTSEWRTLCKESKISPSMCSILSSDASCISFNT